MRVAHVTDVCLPHVGGIEILVDDLARRQAAAGHEVVVLTGAAGRHPDAPSAIEVARPIRRISLARHLAEIRARIGSGEFDVVHGHLSVFSPFTCAVSGHAARTGIPLTLTVHSMWSGRTPVIRAVGGLVGWRTWPARWTAVGSAAALDVRRLLDPKRDVAVVPNAVDTQWWRAAIAQARSLPDRPLTFVSVMRMVERKRPLALVRALHRARLQLPSDTPVRAILVGGGPLSARVADDIARRGMSSWVSMTGQVTREQVRGIYARSDVYVAPADRESFGIAALEARAAGLALVAMRKGGVSDFIDDGVEGFLCADDAAMAHALATLASQPQTLAAMRAHNAAVVPQITWEATLAAYSQCYAESGAMLANRSREVLRDRSLASLA
jgi:glycosyltransferase involved in cell wall biosynthesis